MRAAGIFALGSFDGTPLDPADCERLGLPVAGGGFVARAADPLEGAAAIDRHEEGASTLLFLGRLDDSAALAEALGMPVGQGPAALAHAALRRWGEGARARLPGSWSLLRWDASARRLDMAASYNLRDHFYLARSGNRFAIAPRVSWLASLPWIDDALDPQGLAYALSRARLRIRRAGRTVLRDVQAIEAGAFLTATASGTEVSARPTLIAKPWQGGFEDAVEAATAELRRVVRRTIAPYRRIGVLLSSGLDSSLLAWIASEELGAGQSLVAFTSVAPPGSGLEDEAEMSKATADWLGIGWTPVWPSPEARIFKPTDLTFDHDGPSQSPREYLYETLYATARAQGVELLLDGSLGEASVTRRAVFRAPLRRAKAALRLLKAQFAARQDWAYNAFQVEFTGDFLASLPREMRQVDSFNTTAPLLARDRPAGFARGQIGLGVRALTVPGADFRNAWAYHDPELARLIAGMPAAFLVRDGQSRALARAMLAGHVPEPVWRTRLTAPFSPDYYLRARSEAPSLQSRLNALRDGDADRILDLSWLGAQTAGLVAQPIVDGRQMFRLQLTAHAAEYIQWWRHRRTAGG